MATSDHDAADVHPFLTARHVDDLTDAVRTLSRHMSNLVDTAKRQLDAVNKSIVALQDNTKATAKMLKVLGHATDEGDAVTPGGVARRAQKKA